MARLEIKIEDELLEALNKICEDGARAEFVSAAIKEKINRKIISQDEVYHRIKKLDKLDAESLHDTINNVEITTQIIFEEVKQQNEILNKIVSSKFEKASPYQSAGNHNRLNNDILNEDKMQDILTLALRDVNRKLDRIGNESQVIFAKADTYLEIFKSKKTWYIFGGALFVLICGLRYSYYVQNKQMENLIYQSAFSAKAQDFVNSSCELKNQFGKYVGFNKKVDCNFRF